MKVIYLIRDPRAVMNSRYINWWCQNSSHCIEPEKLCKFDLDDFNAAKEYSIKYPNDFKFIKYEDLLLDWKSEVTKLYQFVMGEQKPSKDFMKKMEDIFVKHKKIDGNKSTADTNFTMKWKYSLKPEQLKKIQDNCETIIKTLGYELV